MKNNKTLLLLNILNTTTSYDEALKSYNYHKSVIDEYLTVDPTKKYRTPKEILNHITETFNIINSLYVFDNNKLYDIRKDKRFKTLTNESLTIYNSLYTIYNELIPKNVTLDKLNKLFGSVEFQCLMDLDEINYDQIVYEETCEKYKGDNISLLAAKQIYDNKVKENNCNTFPVISINQILWVTSFKNPDIMLLDNFYDKFVELGIYSMDNDSLHDFYTKTPQPYDIFKKIENGNITTVKSSHIFYGDVSHFIFDYTDVCKCIKNICQRVFKYSYTPALVCYVIFFMNANDTTEYNYITDNNDIDKTIEFQELYKTMSDTIMSLLNNVQGNNKITPPLDLTIDVLDPNGNIYKINDICSIVDRDKIKLTLNILPQDYINNRFNGYMRDIESDYTKDYIVTQLFEYEEEIFEMKPHHVTWEIFDSTFKYILTCFTKTFMFRSNMQDLQKLKECLAYIVWHIDDVCKFMRKYMQEHLPELCEHYILNDAENIDMHLFKMYEFTQDDIDKLTDSMDNKYNLDLSHYSYSLYFEKEEKEQSGIKEFVKDWVSKDTEVNIEEIDKHKEFVNDCKYRVDWTEENESKNEKTFEQKQEDHKEKLKLLNDNLLQTSFYTIYKNDAFFLNKGINYVLDLCLNDNLTDISVENLDLLLFTKFAKKD